ncbi:MAG: hypothetical protein OHK0052_10300 [Anaerolineales bacterium]
MEKSILDSRKIPALAYSLLMYALGAGVAHYTGTIFNWLTAIVGLSWVFFLVFGALLLEQYFEKPGKTPAQSPLLLLGIVFWTLVAVNTVSLLAMGQVTFSAWLLMTFAVLIALAYALPPLRWQARGYGELTLALLLVGITPALALLLNGGEWHRLLPMLTLPLAPLFLASELTLRLPTYSLEANAPKNLLQRLGWQLAFRIHHLLVMSSYLLIAIALLLGLPFTFGIAALLTLPLGMLEIWYLDRIAEGIKPQWRALTILAIALFSLTAYLLVFTLWTR